MSGVAWEDQLPSSLIGIFKLSDTDRDYYDRDDLDRLRFRANALLLGIFLYAILSTFDMLMYPDYARELVSIRLSATAVMALSYLYFLNAKSRVQRELSVIMFGTTAIVGLIFQGLVDVQTNSFFNFGAAIALFYGGITLFARPAVVLSGAATVIIAYAISLSFTDQNFFMAVVDRILILITLAMIVLSNLHRDQLERAQYADAKALMGAKMEAEKALARALLADRAKDNLLAGVSHELRTPMNAIIGFSDAIRSELFGKIQPASYRDYVNHIHSSGLILRRNIDDLLDLSSSSMGKMGFDETAFRLGGAVSDAVTLCTFRAEESEIALALEGAESDVMIKADRQRLEQAIINLVTNAIKFSQRGQAIKVTLHRTEDGGARISVSDRGCGIAKDALDKITDPFVQQQDDTLKSGYGGLGIGLAIVTNIMDAIGGSLVIESTEGEGTVADLLFPPSRIVDRPGHQTKSAVKHERQQAG